MKNEKKTDNQKGKWSTRKKLLVIMVSLMVALVALYAISFAIDRYNFNKNNRSAPIDYTFYPADYDEDIFEDPEYKELIENGYLYYTDASRGVKLGIEPEDAINHGREIEFMVKHVEHIINGEVEAYNDDFSDIFYKNNKKHERFTKQKLYDVNIIKKSETEVTENGYTYREYEFELYYRIFENNGTFRNDFGDGYKTQHITVSEKDGVFKIDEVRTEKIKV